MRVATRTRGLTRAEIMKRQRQIEAWYPSEERPMPSGEAAGSFFVTDPTTVRLVEEHLIPSMPVALFFSGSYRKEPGGRDALELALADFEATIDATGHRGRYFAVAARDPYDHYTGERGRIHVHAIVDFSPGIRELTTRWADKHGMAKGGLADPGGYYYVARHYINRWNDNVVLDRTALSTSAA